MKEAAARIKINKLLEAAGWRFFPEGNLPANICLEVGTTLKSIDVDALGENFEKTKKGYLDFLLLNEKGFPFIVLEAKAEHKDPLDGKEQARDYAKSQSCRFIILSNGNLHYFWDLERGNPYVIIAFPKPASVKDYQKARPDANKLVNEPVNADYIVLTQRPTYAAEAGWKNETERPAYIKANKLRFLRTYQQRALHALQNDVANGEERFLFEMATGTGKTLISAAAIKLFLRTGNASRVLFLVDRLELEDQAKKAFVAYLSADYKTIVYKENRQDWRKADIVVTTVQSLLVNNKYQQQFSPTDFDLVISDEAHRSIGGNARAVFDFFVGYKLGLTATPRDYLKNLDKKKDDATDPRELESRMLLDTYRTFGCENSQPTFRYSLIDGVNDPEGPFLVNPIVVDARTDVTTKLLSKEGFQVTFTDEQGDDQDQTFKQREFEKRFFAGATNQLFCKTFLENSLRDPASGEVGKSIVFAVSQNHASRLTQILNDMADKMYPGKYQSNFAVQVTSRIPDAQQYTINFANNNLLGSGNFIETYRTSKARVCVTVGMMTTGYDCPDVLNIGLFRPIFSPTDFIQIKGRGTRLHDFREQALDEDLRANIGEPEKKHFKLFDYFANCEYFEKEFKYDQVLKLPRLPTTSSKGGEDGGYGAGGSRAGKALAYQHMGADIMSLIKEEHVSAQGMKVDRMFFQQFEDSVRDNQDIAAAVQQGKWDQVIDFVNQEVFNKPEQYYTLDKLSRAAAVDRRLTLREILEKVFGLIPGFKTKDDLLEEEFAKFVSDYKPSEAETLPAIRHYFKAYAASPQIRHVIDCNDFQELLTSSEFTFADYKAVPEKYRALIPSYVKSYVPVAQFAPQ